MGHKKLRLLCGVVAGSFALASRASADTGMLIGRFNVGDIQRYNAQTGALVGTFTSSLGTAQHATLGPNGNLYLSMGGVIEVDIATGQLVNTLISASDFHNAFHAYPYGLAFAPNGDLFTATPIGDISMARILRFDGTTGAFLGVLAFTEPDLSVPTALVIGSSGDVYIGGGDMNGGGTLLRYNGQDGSLVRQLDSFPGGVSPITLRFGSDGNLYALLASSSGGFAEVRRYDGQTDAFLDVFISSAGEDPGDFDFGPTGNLFVSKSSLANGSFVARVLEFDGQSGALIGEFISPGSIQDVPNILLFTTGFAPLAVPTVSSWGLTMMGLLLLAVGTVICRRIASQRAQCE